MWDGFTGDHTDQDFGVVNMHGRLYDPVSARFLSADPVMGNPLSTQRWNKYAYVENSPMRLVDPSGYDDEPPTPPPPPTDDNGGYTEVPIDGQAPAPPVETNCSDAKTWCYHDGNGHHVDVAERAHAFHVRRHRDRMPLEQPNEQPRGQREATGPVRRDGDGEQR